MPRKRQQPPSQTSEQHELLAKALINRRKPNPKAKTSRREMTPVEKRMIIAFFFCFGCISKVAKLINRPWSTVKSFIERTTLRDGNQSNLERSGRPLLLNRQQRREIIRAAKSNRTMNRTKFRDTYAPKVSLRTVDRVLREANMRKWLAKARPKLKPEHAQKRLAWALERQHWTVENFAKVI